VLLQDTDSSGRTRLTLSWKQGQILAGEQIPPTDYRGIGFLVVPAIFLLPTVKVESGFVLCDPPRNEILLVLHSPY
jgi:hypothetical protein